MQNIRIAASLLTVVSMARLVSAADPVFESRGVGGGGALFSPSFNPAAPDDLFVSCDMSELFRTRNLGRGWETVPFGQVTGNRESQVQFSSANTLYCIDYSLIDGSDARRVKKSTDGGTTWHFLASDPTGSETYYIAVDPGNANRLLITDYSNLYYSSNGGTSFTNVYTNTNGNGVLLSGAFFDGTKIYVGTNDGLLVSGNGGTSFALSTATGLPAGKSIVSFCGAKEGSTVRLFVLMSGQAWADIMVEDQFWEAKKIYSLDVGAAAWVERSGGLPTVDGNALAHVRCARNDIDTVWAAGQKPDELPFVMRSTNGGANWSDVLLIDNNQNVVTGWEGHLGDRQFSYGGGTTGFTVHPLDANRAAFTDYGFVHVTSNGGTSWRQAYVSAANENPAGAATPKNKSYASIGLEDTTNWRLAWLGGNTMWACYSDIRGIRSTDRGATWSFNYTGHSANSSYDCVYIPSTGTAYLATGTAHDLYQTTTLQDSPIDAADGAILYSTNNGAAWQVLHDFNKMVCCLKPDPNVANRMYAGVVHGNGGTQSGSQGGFWVTSNLNAGAASTWTQLAAPARTQGHPVDLDILNDGTLIAVYTGRRVGSTFTDSAGVFVSTNGGTSWTDRSHANMHYYVKDLLVSPHDAAQNTWYASVWSGWNGPQATNNDAGGLYRTANRGTSWTRIFQKARVSSITVDPANANRAFVTTETDGLWTTENLSATSPTFAAIASFAFRQPERVYFDPADGNRIWVTSFGGGMRTALLGTTPTRTEGWVVQ